MSFFRHRYFLLPALLLCAFQALSKSASGAADDSALKVLGAIRDDSARLAGTLDYARSIANVYPSRTIGIVRNALRETQELHLDALSLAAYSRLAIVHLMNADYPRSLSDYLEALKLARKTGNRVEETRNLSSISLIYLRQQDMPRSMQYIRQADSTARHYQLTEAIPGLLSEIGIRYDMMDQHDSAITYFRKSIALAHQQQQPSEELNALVNMAIAMKKRGHFSAAMDLYRQAISMEENLPDRDPTIPIIISGNIANLLFESGDLVQSEALALRTLRQTDSVHDNKAYMQQDLYTLLVRLYEQKKDYPKAFAALQKLSVIKDTVFSSQGAQQLQEAAVRFETELKDNQIAAQQSDIRYRNRLTLFLTVGIVLLLVAAGITYINQRRVRRLNRQILVQKGELEQLNSVKDRIFSAISHDIRTPLSSLFSFSRLLSEGNLSAEKLPLYTAQLNGQLSYTMGMMDNLLHWARSQMQGFHPVPVSLDVAAAVDEAIAFARSEASQKGVHMSQQIPDGLNARGDKQMTALVLRNLVHNAIKYTTRGGIITITGHQKGNVVRVSVTDTGIGIDAAAVAAFNVEQGPMASRSGTSGEKGTGLGLLLCKSLSLVMGGRMELTSEQGKGSCFTLVLPASSSET